MELKEEDARMDCIMHDFERSLCEARRAQHAAYRQAFERSPIDPAQHVIYSQQLYHKLRAKLKRAALRAERHPDTYPRLYRTMRKCSDIALKAAKDAEMACMVAQMRMLSARTHADLLQAVPAEGNGFSQVHNRMIGSSTSSSSYRAHFYVRHTNTSALSNTTAVSYRHNRRIPRNLHVTETFVIQDEDAESAQPQQQTAQHTAQQTAQHRADAAAAAIAVAQAVVAEQQRSPAAQPQPSAQPLPYPAAHTQEDPMLGELFVSSRFFDALCLYSVFTASLIVFTVSFTVSFTVFTDLTPFFWFALINSPPPSPHLSPLHNDAALPLSTTDDHLFTGGTAPMADAVREAEGNADGRASGKSLRV